MCICIITYIDLWKETISLVSSSCYCQATAIVIPQASWQLMRLMVASIKMNSLQKAIIPPLFFVSCVKLPALLGGFAS